MDQGLHQMVCEAVERYMKRRAHKGPITPMEAAWIQACYRI